jgi:hypothetical protein
MDPLGLVWIDLLPARFTAKSVISSFCSGLSLLHSIEPPCQLHTLVAALSLLYHRYLFLSAAKGTCTIISSHEAEF